MPSPIQRAMVLATLEAKTAQPRVLKIGSVEILFIDRVPWAVYDGEVFYPDLPEELKPAVMKLINGWTLRDDKSIFDSPHHVSLTRLPPSEFDFLLVSSLMRSLRPLLRPQPREINIAVTAEELRSRLEAKRIPWPGDEPGKIYLGEP